jgi:hypothetical protein
MRDPNRPLSDLDDLDEVAVERLLSGGDLDDVPAAHRALADLLTLVGAPATDDELAGEGGARALFVANHRPDAAVSPPGRPRRRRRAAVGAFVVVGCLGVTSGLAAAGTLPGAAQDIAANVLAKVGVSVPGANGHSAGHAGVRGRSADARGHQTDHSPSDAGKGKGKTISSIATTTPATGVDKGSEISDTASDGTSQAGDHSTPSSTPGQATATTSGPRAGAGGPDNGDGRGNGSGRGSPTTTPTTPSTTTSTTTQGGDQSGTDGGRP